MATEPAEPQRAQRLNVTVKPETYARLQEARNRRGIEINVSQVADAAINAELDRRDKPGMADVVARLRIESDMRRGAPYRYGHQVGVNWAHRIACWAEICRYAINFEERHVRIEITCGPNETGWRREGPEFIGAFQAPADYTEAPCYSDHEAGVDAVDDPAKCEQFWRGWLAGVKEAFEAIRTDLPPIEPPPEPAGPPATPPGVRDVDPDDIPF